MTIYRVTNEDGAEVRRGDEVINFRGEVATFCYVSRGPEYNGTAKVIVTDPCGNAHEYYERVFKLTVEVVQNAAEPVAETA